MRFIPRSPETVSTLRWFALVSIIGILVAAFEFVAPMGDYPELDYHNRPIIFEPDGYDREFVFVPNVAVHPRKFQATEAHPRALNRPCTVLTGTDGRPSDNHQAVGEEHQKQISRAWFAHPKDWLIPLGSGTIGCAGLGIISRNLVVGGLLFACGLSGIVYGELMWAWLAQ